MTLERPPSLGAPLPSPGRGFVAAAGSRLSFSRRPCVVCLQPARREKLSAFFRVFPPFFTPPALLQRATAKHVTPVCVSSPHFGSCPVESCVPITVPSPPDPCRRTLLFNASMAPPSQPSRPTSCHFTSLHSKSSPQLHVHGLAAGRCLRAGACPPWRGASRSGEQSEWVPCSYFFRCASRNSTSFSANTIRFFSLRNPCPSSAKVRISTGLFSFFMAS